jgi:hypothetical protein
MRKRCCSVVEPLHLNFARVAINFHLEGELSFEKDALAWLEEVYE